MEILQTPVTDLSEHLDVYRMHVKSVDSTNSLAARIVDVHVSRTWIDSACEVAERENLTLVSCNSLNVYSEQDIESYVQAVISADTQTQGRGRLGRTWIDADQRSLCASYVVRVPRHVYQQCGQWISTIAGLSVMKAVCSAVASVCDVRVEDMTKLKWPNDLYCGDAKFGGILVETHSSSVASEHDGDDVVFIVGVGLNGDIVPKVDSAYATTSLHCMIESVREDAGIGEATGTYEQYHARLMDAIIAGTVSQLNSFLSGLTCDVERAISIVRAQVIVHSAIIGRDVTALLPDGSVICGIALDIDADAALVIALKNGQEKHITVGDVSVRLT